MRRNGFSLVEMLVGLMIFAVGALALAGSMGFVSEQLRASDMRTERNVAYQQATEQLFALEFDALDDRAQANALALGDYGVWWSVESLGWALKEVELYSEGPGYVDGAWSPAAVDTLVIRIARPNQ